MIVLFIVIYFLAGCIDRMCQPFFQDVSIFFVWFVFSTIVSPFCCCGFLTFPSLWEISFSGQMIVKRSVGYWA